MHVKSSISLAFLLALVAGATQTLAQTPGTLKWQYALPGGMIQSSPAIAADGTIYVGHRNSWPGLYAVNPDGTEKWIFLGVDVWSTPAIGPDGTIYFGSESTPELFAVNPDGSEKWVLQVSDDVYASPAIGRDGTIYIVTTNDVDNFHAVNPDGTIQWTLSAGDQSRSSPVIAPDGTIYVSGSGLVIDAIHPDGFVKWSADLPGDEGSYSFQAAPAIGIDGAIYIGGGNGNLYALEPDDGAIRWDYDTGALIVTSPAIGPDGTLYIGSWNGILSAVNPDGTSKWDFTAGNQIDSSPAIGADGTVYFASWGGRLWAVESDGVEAWWFSIGGQPVSSPIIGGDGTVYIGGLDDLFAVYSDSLGLAESVWPAFRQDIERTGRAEALPISLTLGVPYQIGLQAGQAQVYSVATDADEALLVRVTGDFGIDALSVYAQYGGSTYQTHTQTPLSTWELPIAPTIAGEYLVSVVGTGVDAAGGQYTILAEYAAQHLSNVEPRSGGNAGEVRLRISGLGFETGMTVELLSSGLPTLLADEVTLGSVSDLLARFDLTGANTGLYDLRLTWPSTASETLVEAFEITTGTGGVLEANLEAPDTVRPDRRYTLWLSYANTGDADLLAPLFSVRSSDALLSLHANRIESAAIEVLGTGGSADPDVLGVGESRRVPIYFIASGSGAVNFSLDETVGGSESVDWEAQKAWMKPPDMDQGDWDTLWPALKARLGITWDDYLGVLRADSRRLRARGDEAYDVGEMIRLEMLLAGGDPVTSVSGILRHADTFEPLGGVVLRLHSGDGSVLRQTVSSYTPPGEFLFQDLPDDTYDLQVDGYLLDPPVSVPVTGLDVTGLEVYLQDLPAQEDLPPQDVAQHDPAVTLDDAGTVYLVWQEGVKIWWARNPGTGWDAAGSIPNALGSNPAISWDPGLLDGGVNPGLFVAWETVESPQVLEWSVGEPTESGVSWTEPVALTSDGFDDSAAAVFVDDLHDPVVLWLQRDFSTADDTDLYYLVPSLTTAGLSSPAKPLEDTFTLGLTQQLCDLVETRFIRSLDPAIPVIGGEYGFWVFGQMCGAHECTLNWSVGGPGASILVSMGHEESVFSGNASTYSAQWDTDVCSCQYLLNTASLGMSVPISLAWQTSQFGVPLYFDEVAQIAPLSALIGTAYLNSSGTGQLDGNVSWVSNFPEMWNQGTVTFSFDEEITGVLHSDQGGLSALISGNAWVWWSQTAPPPHFEFTDVCLELEGEAYAGFGTLLQVFSQQWGDCLISPTSSSNRTSGLDSVLPKKSAVEVWEVPFAEDLTYTKSSFEGTGASYEGSSVLADISSDLYHDGRPTVDKSSADEMMVAWVKDEVADNLGSQVFAATYSGTGWNTPVALTSETDFNKDPFLAFNGGLPLVIWSSASNAGLDYSTASAEEILDAMQNADLMYSRRVGGTWSAPAAVASLPGRDEQPASAVSPGGVMTAAWLNQSESGWKLYTSYLSGPNWSTPIVITSAALISQPTVAFIGSSAAVIWAQDDDGDPESKNDWRLYWSIRTASTWSEPEPIDLASFLERPGNIPMSLAISLPPPDPDCCDNCIGQNPSSPNPPSNVQQPLESAASNAVAGLDPNEKTGTLGTAAGHHVQAGDQLRYTVYFENLPAAPAPAQEVFVTDCLPLDLDWTTLRLDEVAFGDQISANPGGDFLFRQRITIPDYRPGETKTWWVDIEPTFDFPSGCLDIVFRTLDPETGELPGDPFAGFLPPEDGTGRGQGHVGFSIASKPDLADGTILSNFASIVFDTNAPILTNSWINTIGDPVVFHTLTVNHTGSGSGTVTSDPPGIDCGTECTEDYLAGTLVTLSADPEPGSLFRGFGGDSDCEDGAAIMNLNITCTARFELPEIFEDGFESGGTSAWSGAVP